MAPAFPSACGSRLPWESVGVNVVRALEDHFGAPVAGAVTRPEGFSPAVAAVVDFENGSRAFVKAVNREANPDSPGMYRREARTAAQLPSRRWAPRLLWTYDDDEWVALAFEPVDGSSPHLPWEEADLGRVLDALTRLASDNTPTSVDVAGIAFLGPAFRHWRGLAEAGAEAVGRLALLEPWAARNIGRLARLEPDWEAAAAGGTLVHADLRADNILLTADHVVFVDWASAVLAAPWLDLLFFLPSVAMQGGPRPAEVFQGHPLGARAPAAPVTAVLCALAGFFLGNALQPAPPGLPTLRAFQLGQGLEAAAWLRERTGWA
jgi:hypothetical protein